MTFLKDEKWKPPKCPSAVGWISNLWSSHAMEYYLAINKKEALIHATTWMNLENMLSE